jgi:hypothetical protein
MGGAAARWAARYVAKKHGAWNLSDGQKGTTATKPVTAASPFVATKVKGLPIQSSALYRFEGHHDLRLVLGT